MHLKKFKAKTVSEINEQGPYLCSVIWSFSMEVHKEYACYFDILVISDVTVPWLLMGIWSHKRNKNVLVATSKTDGSSVMMTILALVSLSLTI